MLSQVQKAIVETPGNLIVRASAGTGKTHTMVSKIKYDIQNHNSHKVIAAITFTIKAANEIKNRLMFDTSYHFIGTNNSFVIEEIIKPFMKDVFGMEYKLEMSTDYSIKVKNFEEGIYKIKNEHILSSYQNSKNNFVFQLALFILKRSQACQLYLKAKYFKIYIDEYQDCDRDMHNFFMYLCQNLNIDVFVVGDEKQSIYMWRGAYPAAFLEIWQMDNFSKHYLRDNFRSCQQIQNYSNLLCEETRGLYQTTEDKSSVVLIKTTEANWSKDVLRYINKSSKTALLRYKRTNAQLGAEILTEHDFECTYIPQTPISFITTETAWLYTSIAKYFVLDKYSAYDLFSEMPGEISTGKNVLSKIKYSLELLSKNIANEDFDNFEKQLEQFAVSFGYKTQKEHSRNLYETICDERYHAAFYTEELDNIAITFHSAKGLEFNQVIVFVEDYNLVDEESIYNHYVAVTRAKEKLVLVYLDNSASQDYLLNFQKILSKNGLDLTDVLSIVE